VLILAALDSSVLPTLGGVDALTILLAARHPELWPYYAMCSTAGSVGGASVAYRLSGLGVLHRRIKGAVFDRVTAFVKRFGSPALSLAALLPPPFPTSAFVISAGATRYRFIAFVLSFGVGRACKGAQKINILSCLTTTSGTEGTTHLLVDNVNRARKALASAQLSYTEADVLHVELPNKPGALGKFAMKLADNNINITSGCATGGKSSMLRERPRNVPRCSKPSSVTCSWVSISYR